MYEEQVIIEGDVSLGATLCLPEDAGLVRRVPALLLIGGTGGDTRDGDLAPSRNPGVYATHPRGTLRRIAHALAQAGIASLRFDKRGVGKSGGDSASSDYETDLSDAGACYRWLRCRGEVDCTRVGVLGHSAGALLACQLCRDIPGIACAALLAALYEPAENMIRWNWGRTARHWLEFTREQRAYLIKLRPRDVVAGEGVEEFIAAAKRGDPTVTLSAHGISMDFSTRRFQQDLARPCSGEFRHVQCPALILHGGADLNVRVEDALEAYRALKEAGNHDVELAILPGLDHSYIPVSKDPVKRIWERVSLEAWQRPMSPLALEAILRWAVRVLRPAQ